MIRRAWCLLLCLLVLSSCARAGYTDSISCAEISRAIREQIGDTQEYGEYDDARADLGIEGEYTSQSVIYSTNVNDINEIGVFHASSEDKSRELQTACQRYLDEQRQDMRAFIASYAPEELPKLDGASVKRYGSYVVYVILSPDDIDAAQSTARQMLKKK